MECREEAAGRWRGNWIWRLVETAQHDCGSNVVLLLTCGA